MHALGCLFLCLVALAERASGNEFRLNNTASFVSFAKSVNSGIGYLGTTVFLDSDVDLAGDFSAQFVPIGFYESSTIFDYFQGTFDGQGHVISNLVRVFSSVPFVGLFGFSQGSVIRNIVMDASCSIGSSLTSQYSRVGGIIGECRALNDICDVENVVNMGSVVFQGATTTKDAHLGGIVGYFSETFKKSVVKNCASYGTIVSTGTTQRATNIGGIAGFVEGSSYPIMKFIQNCVSYSPIVFNGTAGTEFAIGGIAAVSSYGGVENCLSAGTFTFAGSNGFIGSIVGYAKGSDPNRIAHSFWTGGIGDYYAYGKKEMTSSVVVTESSVVVFSEEAANVLNSYTSSARWSRWVANPNKNIIHFVINSGKGFSLSSYLVLLPVLKEGTGHAFSGFFTDPLFTEKFDQPYVLTDTQLYGGWVYAVSFDVNGGNSSHDPKGIVYNSFYGMLPTPTRTGYSFAGWYTAAIRGSEVTNSTVFRTLSSQTLHAHWSPRKFTVTFDVNKGDKLPIPSKEITYDRIYGELPTPTRAGHSFKGWFTSPSDGNRVDRDMVCKLTSAQTLYAQWSEGNYSLSFDFGNGTVCRAFYAFNESIDYPKDMEKSGYVFSGWDPKITLIPDHNVTVKALWIEEGASYGSGNNGNSKKGGASTIASTTVVLCVAVPVSFVAIAVLAFLLLVMFLKVKHVAKKGEYDKLDVGLERSDSDSDTLRCTRTISDTDYKVSTSTLAGKKLDTLYKMYPPNYTKPLLKDALVSAGLTEEQAGAVIEECKKRMTTTKKSTGKLEGFTKEDAAALAMYTYEFSTGGFEKNPYRIISKCLIERNFNSLQSASGLLYIVMTALRKLPRVTGTTLYRGLRCEVSTDNDHYHKGNIITWPALSSTSPDMKATKAFLAKGSKTGKATGTLFIIENGWGYDIQPYSLFPEEAEVLLEPERQFKVASVAQEEGLVVITLKMLDTPLALPQVFGEGKN